MSPVAPPPGRRLSAVIPGANAPSVSDPPAGFDDFVDSIHQQNLAVLVQRFGLSTAVGCHRPRGSDDRVYVAAPDLPTLGPTAAMVLFDQVRRMLDQPHAHHRIETERGLLVGVVSSGPQSRSAYLLTETDGRERPPIPVGASVGGRRSGRWDGRPGAFPGSDDASA